MSAPLFSRFVFRGATIFDGRSDRLLKDQDVTVEAGVIKRIGRSAPADDSAASVDARPYTLMPGLIDAHFHCNSPSFDVPGLDNVPPSHMAQHARRYLELMTDQGFTTVRDAGGADIGLARAVDEGLINGPRLLVCGKALSQTGGHGDLRKPASPSPCPCGYTGALSVVVDGVDEMRRQVRRAFHDGAHHIKLFVSGGVLSPSDPIWMDQFHDTEIRAATEEAATRRSYVMAHAHTANAAIRCVQNGVRSIEHGTMLDREAADRIAEHGAYVVPTTSVINGLMSEQFALPPEAVDKLRGFVDTAFESIAHCVAAGVPLGFGTDYFDNLHGQESQELLERAKVQSNADVLRSATSINASLIQLGDRTGSIEADKCADIILVDGNPLEDISCAANPRNIKLVMKDGKIMKNEIGGHEWGMSQ